MCMLEQIIIHMLLFVRDDAPCLLENLLFQHLLFDLLSLVMVSALQLLKDFLLHLIFLVRFSVVHTLLLMLLHLVMLNSDTNRHVNSDSNVDCDSVIVGHGSCSASTGMSTTCSAAACCST